MYMDVHVTPYIPGADGAKNSLVGACELFQLTDYHQEYNWNLYNGKYWRIIIVL